MTFFSVRQGLFFCLYILCFAFLTNIVMVGRAAASPLLLADVQKNDPPDLLFVLKALDGQRNAIINMQRELVARVGLNPEHGGSGESEKVAWVETWLADRGFTNVQRQDYPDARVPGKVRPNLIVRWSGKQTTDKKTAASQPRRTLWVFARLDVPPSGPVEDWNSDPFSLRVNGDLLYGRGVEDNNQAIVTSLILLGSLQKQSAIPPMDLGLVLLSGGLVGFGPGVDHVLDERPDLFRKDDLYLALHYGSEDGGVIEVAEKKNVWLKVTVIGRQGYAGQSEGTANSFSAGIELAHDLPSLSIAYPDKNPLFHGGSVFTPTRVESNNVDGNHISGLFTFYIDVRIDPSYPTGTAEKAVRDASRKVETEYGVHIKVERVEDIPSTIPTSADAPVIIGLQRAVEKQLGLTPRLTGINGATMATALRSKGYAVAVWGIQNNLRNRVNEYFSISAHIEQARVLARMLYDMQLAQNSTAEGTVRSGEKDK